MTPSRWIKLTLAHLLVPCLAACSASPSEIAPPKVGSDRDAHGCIASAGYLWCERTRQCERPWELARDRGFAVNEKAFADFCNGPK